MPRKIDIQEQIEIAMDRDDIAATDARARAEKMLGNHYDDFTKRQRKAWEFLYADGKVDAELCRLLNYKPNRFLLEAIRKISKLPSARAIATREEYQVRHQ